jgi:hypothetical protein
MHLFESILDANHRAVAGDASSRTASDEDMACTGFFHGNGLT